MYAIIQNGTVANIVMADADTATANGWIASTGASIGDTWDGTDFARPAKYPDLATGKEMRLQELAQRRYEAEEGGTTLGGNPLATDRMTQSKITAAYVKASVDADYEITAWKNRAGDILYTHSGNHHRSGQRHRGSCAGVFRQRGQPIE